MQRAAIVGGGTIGGGWAARFLLFGWDVTLFDPADGAMEAVEAVIARARIALPGIHARRLPEEGRLVRAATLEEAVAGAVWVQESVPERLDLKRDVLGRIAAAAGPQAVIGSSTSGFMARELQEGLAEPGRVLVAHPFVPVYLIPLVELAVSPANPADVVARAEEILEGLGMAPLVIRGEVPGHVADRLLEAVWREALWLVKDGVATTGEIDDAIRLGFGLRWAQMGLFETYRLGGGAAGMRHFLQQFAPALAWPWSKLTDVPEMDDALIETIAAQSDAQAGGRTIAEMEAARDANLVAILNTLRARGGGAGARLAALDRAAEGADVDPARPVETLARAVPLDWTDYNGHMTEARYLDGFAAATDRFMELIGADAAYVAGGLSFFTAESHIRHLGEALAGDTLAITTQVLGSGARKMHLFHEMRAGDRLVATGEHMLIHVSLETRRATEMAPEVARRLGRIAEGHASLGTPEGAGGRVRRQD